MLIFNPETLMSGLDAGTLIPLSADLAKNIVEFAKKQPPDRRRKLAKALLEVYEQLDVVARNGDSIVEFLSRSREKGEGDASVLDQLNSHLPGPSLDVTAVRLGPAEAHVIGNLIAEQEYAIRQLSAALASSELKHLHLFAPGLPHLTATIDKKRRSLTLMMGSFPYAKGYQLKGPLDGRTLQKRLEELGFTHSSPFHPTAAGFTLLFSTTELDEARERVDAIKAGREELRRLIQTHFNIAEIVGEP